VLITEMMNTAIEALCDFIEVRHNEKIRVIKDVAAAAVGISIAVWALIVVVEVARTLATALRLRKDMNERNRRREDNVKVACDISVYSTVLYL
jgi:hypothetical protein